MVSAIEGAAGPGSVLIAGGGLWADALSRVVTKGGGGLLLGTSRDHALSLISTHRPSAIVAGPPLNDDELIEFCRAAVQTSSVSTVLAAVNRADITLRRALVEVGVARVCIVPSAAGDLAVSMINAARLTTRAHARIPLTVVASIQTREGRLTGTTRDLSEGGICLERVAERVMRGPAKVELTLPGDRRPVVAAAHVVWSTGADGDFRAGLFFENIDAVNLAKIRALVARSPDASFAY